MSWSPPPPPGFVHVFRWTRWLGYLCVMCKAQADMLAAYDCDHYNDCPGWVEPVQLYELAQVWNGGNAHVPHGQPVYEQESLW